MSEQALELWIPRPPDNANNRGHWSHATKEKRALHVELDTRVQARLIPNPPATPFASISLSSEWFTTGRQQTLDPDNAIRRLKPVIDWLVKRGYLAGDTPKEVSLTMPVQRRADPPKDAPPLSSVRLTLTPVPF